MGGFASSFETAASSGANGTVSGVPVGNSVGGEGGLASASSFSTPSTLPDIGTGGGTDWTGQAFAPSAMTQQLPEPGLPETSDWKPQPVPETPSSNLLEKFAPKPATGSGLLAETPLQPKRGESEGLRNVNPILSKLAAEHPENPVHLKGGLLGAPEPAQPQIKPPNPFAQRKDELPKLPKIDWGAYDKHQTEAAPSLLGPARPNRFADPDFEKSYWQSAEAYKAEFEQRQRMPPATEEPRQGDDVRIVIPQDELTYKRAVFDPAIGDKTTPPAWKKEVLNKQHKDWEMFNRSLDNRHDLGENQKFTLAQIFAAEGGTAKDPAGSASSGILKDTLDDARKRVPGLENVKTPSDLTIDQRVAVMKDYFDRNMSTIGGAKALETLPSPEAAAAFGDTIYRHGSGEGAKAIQRAIRLVAPERVKADGKMGPETLKAFNELASDPKTRIKLLDYLTQERLLLTKGVEVERMDHFRFPSRR